MLISLRIPDELLSEIDAEAKADGRSRNSILVRRLKGGSHGSVAVDDTRRADERSGNGARLPAVNPVRTVGGAEHPLSVDARKQVSDQLRQTIAQIEANPEVVSEQSIRSICGREAQDPDSAEWARCGLPMGHRSPNHGAWIPFRKVD